MHFLMFRETQPAKYLSISIYLEIGLQTFLRNWPVVAGAYKSEVCLVGHQARNSCKDDVAVLNQRQSGGRIPSLLETLVFLKTF